MLEPILEVLTSPPLGAVALGDKRWLKMMKQQVQSAKLDIVADLATADMKLKDVLNMKVGDVIPLAIEDLIEGKIDGIPVMQCKYGLFNGQYALKVEKLLRSNAMEYVKGESNGD
jgi:flagellar motor switch protein FliM